VTMANPPVLSAAKPGTCAAVLQDPLRSVTRKPDCLNGVVEAVYQPPATQPAAVHEIEVTAAFPPVFSAVVPGTFSALRHRPLTSVATHASRRSRPCRLRYQPPAAQLPTDPQDSCVSSERPPLFRAAMPSPDAAALGHDVHLGVAQLVDKAATHGAVTGIDAPHRVDRRFALGEQVKARNPTCRPPTAAPLFDDERGPGRRGREAAATEVAGPAGQAAACGWA
jgi:hypothetical protein